MHSSPAEALKLLWGVLTKDLQGTKYTYLTYTYIFDAICIYRGNFPLRPVIQVLDDFDIQPFPQTIPLLSVACSRLGMMNILASMQTSKNWQISQTSAGRLCIIHSVTVPLTLSIPNGRCARSITDVEIFRWYYIASSISMIIAYGVTSDDMGSCSRHLCSSPVLLYRRSSLLTAHASPIQLCLAC